MKKILVIQGHPDAGNGHFGQALAEAYAEGAIAAGHEVARIEIAHLDFPLLRNAVRWHDTLAPIALRAPQASLRWADHLAFFFPLWLGSMPALAKGFMEQVFRPGFGFAETAGRSPRPLLQHRSARIVITMGMPAAWHRRYYRPRGSNGLEKGILNFCGIRPVRETFVGLVEAPSAPERRRWLDKIERLGRQAR